MNVVRTKYDFLREEWAMRISTFMPMPTLHIYQLGNHVIIPHLIPE